MFVSALSIYPVKGCRGLSLRSANVDTLGLVGDRRFMFVSEEGNQLTQREAPRLALIDTDLSEDRLRLSSGGFGTLEVPLIQPDAPLRTVAIWSTHGLRAEDCGEESHRWISDFLGTKSRLVRIGAAFRREVKNTTGPAADLVTFADAYPLLVLSEASLADLNARLEEHGEPALPMNRFRPNLVIAGCDAYEEDTWTRIKVGSVRFRTGGPCARCIVTTTDQFTGERGKEPLRTLASYRRDPVQPSNVNFGQNLINEDKSGLIAVGNPIVKR